MLWCYVNRAGNVLWIVFRCNGFRYSRSGEEIALLNGIWTFFILVSIIVSIATHHADRITQGIFQGAKDGVLFSFGLISIIAFWLGIMEIAQQAGVIAMLSKILSPLVRWLYPSVPRDHPAMGFLIANMSANLLGLGNAATPLGISAMRHLQMLANEKDKATDAMCTLLALNTASLTLIPTTVIGLRITFQSRAPSDIVLPSALATLIATVAAVFFDRYFRAHERRKVRR